MPTKAVVERPPEVTAAIAEWEKILAELPFGRAEIAVRMLEQKGVHSEKELRDANELLVEVAKGSGRVEDYWGKKISLANAVHKMLLDLARPARTLAKRLRERIEAQMRAFRERQEADKRAQQRLLEQAAADVKQQQQEKANALLSAGKIKEFAAAKTQADALVAPIVVSEKPKLEGTKERPNWEITSIDWPALVTAMHEGKVPFEAGKPDEAFIKRRARENNGLNWPGVKVKPVIGFAVSTKG